MSTPPDGPPTGSPPPRVPDPAGGLPSGAPPAAPPWHGWTPARPTHPRATASLVLGIVGLTGVLVVVTFVVSPLAWYFGAVARREAQRDEQRWAPSGAATAGLVTGVIGTVLLVGGTVVLVGLAVLSTLAAGTDTGYGG